MGRWLFFKPVLWAVLVGCLTASLSGCTEEDPAPLYIDVRYQVRCIDCEPRAPDDPVRDVELLDGELGFTVECSVVQRGDDQLLNFRAAYIDDDRPSSNFSLRMEQVTLDDNDPGPDCRVTVAEGANSYRGECTTEEPDGAAPCQIDLRVEEKIVFGEVFCDGVPNRTNAMTARHLVAPGTEDEPAEFELHGCTGL
jgi:hypothetical protein